MEAMPLRLLPAWKVPTLLALGLFICFYAYNFVRDVLQPYVQESKNKFFKLPVSVVNTTLPCVAYVLLSLVYLPGVLAATLQLRRGTKYHRFPDWLDHWLQHRKQIGLLSFFCAALHALYSFCLPLRRSHRYDLVNLAVKQSQPLGRRLCQLLGDWYKVAAQEGADLPGETHSLYVGALSPELAVVSNGSGKNSNDPQYPPEHKTHHCSLPPLPPSNCLCLNSPPCQGSSLYSVNPIFP
ncbi:hypothetical protein P7K49_014228 [Saguinus oedipus]|uniref:STEAP3 metalloreductase n=1 Tax=Saguinus oedipus TaxID=9490 RepID=A0ABQ9VI80_SAGOE|nr:hypothetical protein P7K49_014228 [Saguinus oedipus]